MCCFRQRAVVLATKRWNGARRIVKASCSPHVVADSVSGIPSGGSMTCESGARHRVITVARLGKVTRGLLMPGLRLSRAHRPCMQNQTHLVVRENSRQAAAALLLAKPELRQELSVRAAVRC